MGVRVPPSAPANAHDVVKDVFDRTYGKPMVRQQTQLVADIRIVYQDCTDVDP
jgi:hypothetical protein